MDDRDQIRGPFGHPAFRRFWVCRLLSALVFQMQGVALGWFVYDLTHSAFDLGLIGLAQFLPAAGLVLVTGHVADRLPRRRIMLAAYTVQGAGSLGLLLASQAAPSLPALLALVTLIGAARAFEAPAMQAMVPGLVPPALFTRAVGHYSAANQIAQLSGPALGGLLYGLGAGLVFGLAAVAMAGAVGLMASLQAAHRPQAREPASWPVLIAGITFIAQRPAILGAISLDLFAVLFGGATALMPVYARDILVAGPWGLGLLRCAPAAGALAMATLLARRPVGRPAGRIMLGAVALFGLATIVFGLSTNLLLSVAALVVIGASDMVSVVVRQSLVQLGTPDAMRGRVAAVNTVFIGTSNQLGEFESGLTAAWFGAVPAVVLGGIGTLAVVALWAWRFPRLRRLERLDAESIAAATAPRPAAALG